MTAIRSTVTVSISIFLVAILATACFWTHSLYDTAVEHTYRDQVAEIRVFRHFLAEKGPLRVENGVLYAGRERLNGNHELPDLMASVYGGNATIFLGDVRIATSVRKQDGTRADGTHLVGPAHEALFDRGQTYRGQSPILGVEHMATYEPLRDRGGKVIGALYVGIPCRDFLAAYRSDATRIFLLCGGVFVFFAGLWSLVMKEKRLMHARLVESELRYRTVFETTGCATVIVEPDTTISLANAGFLRMVGVPRDEIEGRASFADFVREPDRSRMRTYHLMRRGLAEGTAPPSYEFTLYSIDGQRHEVACTVGMIAGTGRSVLSFLDITDRKAAERELRLTQASVDAAVACIYRITEDGRVVAVNDAATRMLGYSREEFLCSHVWDFDPNMTAEGWPEHWRELREKRTLTFESHHRSKDGRVSPTEVALSIADFEGVEYNFAFVRDISIRKGFEEALRTSEKLFRHVFEHSAIGISVADLAGRIVVCNPAFADIVGYHPDELAGTRFDEITHPDDVERGREEVFRLVNSGASAVSFEKRYLHKDGTVRWGRLSVSLVNDAAGRPDRVIAVIDDMTERRMAEERARRANEQIRLIADSAPSFISFLDRDLTYRFVNRRYESWFGIPRDEILGRRCGELHGAAAFAEIEPHLLRALGGEEVSLNHDLVNRAGELRHLETIFIPQRGEDGEVQGVVVQVHDITEIKRAEAMLAAEREVLAVIAAGTASIPETLGILCRRIEEIASGARCSVLLMNDAQDALSFCAGPSLPDSYNAALTRVSVGEGVGSCGTAAFQRQQVIVRDIATDPLWEGYAKLPLRHGLRACWSTPIVSQKGEVYGTFAMYYGEPREPKAYELLLVAHAADVARIAIERLRSVAELADVRWRLQVILDSIPDLIWLKDRDSLYLAVNEAFAQSAGLTPEGFVGRNDLDVWPVDLAEAYRAADAAVMESGNPWVAEEMLEDFSGRRVWLETVKTPIKDASGAIVGTVGIARNIERRKEAEEALRKSEEKFSVAFHTIPDAVTLSRLDTGVFLEVNEGFTSLFGFTAGEAIGKTSYDLGLWFDPDERDRLIGPLCAAGFVSGIEGRFRRKNGEVITGLMAGNVFEIDGVQYAIVIVRDITERILAMEALRESEERFRQIFVQNEDAIVLFRRSTFEVLDANPRAEELFGYPTRDLVRLGHWSLLQPDESGKFIRGIARLDGHGSFQIDRMGCVRRDGSRFTVSIWGKAITLHDDEVVYCSIRDISEKIRIEEQMRETQAKLIQTNKMTSLGMLVSGIAHEINNPNNFIGINSSILADVWRDARSVLARCHDEDGLRLAGMPFPEMEQMVPRLLDGLTKGSERIAAIIRNLREFSRDGGALVAVAVDIAKVMDDAILILTHQIHKHTDNLLLDVPATLPRVRGNAQQIEQVVINLMLNALQALPGRQAKLVISVSHDPEAATVVIVVRDEGRGMAREVLERVTEPFFSTRLEEGGTGLGLSIAASIVKDHAGTLQFESEPGVGTTVTVTLPVARDMAALTTGVS